MKYKLQNSQELSLNDNNLVHLPESISRCENLLKLSVGGNRLIDLPESVCQLKNLTELSLPGKKEELLVLIVVNYGQLVQAQRFKKIS